MIPLQMKAAKVEPERTIQPEKGKFRLRCIRSESEEVARPSDVLMTDETP
jgi:hypothetical protein